MRNYNVTEEKLSQKVKNVDEPFIFFTLFVESLRERYLIVQSSFLNRHFSDFSSHPFRMSVTINQVT